MSTRSGQSPRERFPLRAGDSEQSMDWGGERRTYLVHLPAGHDGSHALPAVVVLHGGAMNGWFTAYHTGMNATADRGGFVVAYPNGTSPLGDRILTWNVGFGFGYALKHGIDDVGFMRAMVGRLVNEQGVDPLKVYATGISNGGMMSYRLASEASDVFAAVAPIAGAAAGMARLGGRNVAFPPPSRPVSVMAFHGMQDRFVPYGGGQGTGMTNAVYPPVRWSIDAWVGYDRCDPAPDVWTSPTGNIIREWHGGGSEGAEVVLYSIRDGGHTWPGGVERTTLMQDQARMMRRFTGSLGTTTQEISANELMWQFFQRHTR